MYVLDNFVRDKFFEDISIFLEKYKIIDNTFLLEGIVVNLSWKANNTEAKEDFRKIYKNLYQRQFTLLEVLAIKQQLEPARQVFSLLKEYIYNNHIEISWPDILNLFISYKNQELIQHPEPIKLFPLIDNQPTRLTPPLYIIIGAPDTDSEIEEDSEEELNSEEEIEESEEEEILVDN